MTLPMFMLVATDTVAHDSLLDSIIHTFGVDWSNITAQGINFAIFSLILWKFAFAPLMRVIDTRHKEIQDGLQYAEDSKARLADVERQTAEKLEEAASEANTVVAEARERAENFVDGQKRKAVKEAQQIIEKSRENIEQERKHMMAEAKKDVADLVAKVSAKVLEKELGPQDQERFAIAAGKEI